MSKTNAAADNPRDELNEALSLERLFGVKGLVAVVTGGATGIGLMCTQALATHGARVYIIGRREDALKKAVDNYHEHAQGEIIPLQGDVTSKADLQKLVEQVEAKEPGGIHVLINNAGIEGPKSPIDPKEPAEKIKEAQFDTEDFDQWDSVWRTNVSAVYFTTLAFLPLLSKSTGGKGMGDKEGTKGGYTSGVITIASISGLIKMSQNHFAYNASKAASLHLTRMMATEFGHVGVRFNSICPGVFPSEMTAKEESDSRGKSDVSGTFDPKKLGIPAERPGELEEMVATVLYLCGRGGQYCDGVMLNVDGGTLLTNPSVA